jgi:hypothetical protein
VGGQHDDDLLPHHPPLRVVHVVHLGGSVVGLQRGERRGGA